jgi:hypothetical protein
VHQTTLVVIPIPPTTNGVERTRQRYVSSFLAFYKRRPLRPSSAPDSSPSSSCKICRQDLLGMLAYCPRREVEPTVWERLAASFFTVLVCTVLVWPSWCSTPRASLSKLMPISRPTMHHSSCCQPERMLADLEKVVLVEATACRSGYSLSLHFSNLVFLSTASSYLQRSSIPFAYTQTERHRCLCSAAAFLPCKRCLPCPFSPQAVFVSGWQATTRR